MGRMRADVTADISGLPGLAAQGRQYIRRQIGSGVALGLSLVAPRPLSECLVMAVAAASVLNLIDGKTFSAGLLKELKSRSRLADSAVESQNRVEELFAMTEMLQCAEGHDDAALVLETTARRLLPAFSGALYVFNASRDRLDLKRKWNETAGFTPGPSLLPANCWALKRGKNHINDRAENTLCCLHHVGEAATLEVPMIARGSIYGLLVLGLECPGAFEQLKDTRRLARALADSMSLAMANIALNEKLRTQSLRDPLTGLYNRRYMEDVLERTLSLAERQRSSTAVLMIDLDNFKGLNDTHGHAKGDAVLRDVAAALVGGLRPTDVVSRYGGEELLVILPDCSLEDALIKAEGLRARIEGLSEVHGATISASIGISAVPTCASARADAVALADAALYRAKNEGKNCVRSAAVQPPMPALRDVA